MDTTEPFVQPLGDDTPCGPNLEYDSEFLALETLASPTPERAVGDTVKQAEEPEWRDVARQAEQLAGRTRDLRVALHLATAWLNTDGLVRWSEGMGLVRQLLERYWDNVHPRLDDGDPIERTNALAVLSSADGMLSHLRGTPVLHAERVGSFTLRDLRLLSGTLKLGEEGAERAEVSPDHVDAVVEHAEADHLLAVETAIADAIAHVETIGALFDERTPGMGPDVDPLRRELRELHGFLRAQVERRMPDAANDAVDGEPQPEDGAADALPGAINARGPIRGPDDIRRMLDDICAWYARNEPSSPVRPLLRRAQGLVGLGFGELLRAIAPGGFSEFQHLAGETGEHDGG